MNNPKTIKFLKNRAIEYGNLGVINALEKAFPVYNNTVYRASNINLDRKIANFIYDTMPSNVYGWFHPDMIKVKYVRDENNKRKITGIRKTGVHRSEMLLLDAHNKLNLKIELNNFGSPVKK